MRLEPQKRVAAQQQAVAPVSSSRRAGAGPERAGLCELLIYSSLSSEKPLLARMRGDSTECCCWMGSQEQLNCKQLKKKGLPAVGTRVRLRGGSKHFTRASRNGSGAEGAPFPPPRPHPHPGGRQRRT